MWLAQYVALCAGMPTVAKITLAADLVTAIAYLAIPVGLATILVKKRDTVSHPGIMAAFAAFITACGATHLVNAVFTPFTASAHTNVEAAVKIATAGISASTALVFMAFLPKIQTLVSARHRQRDLEAQVEERTAENARLLLEKEELVLEINHQLGNQLNVIGSAIRIERRRAKTSEEVRLLERLECVAEDLASKYRDNESKYAQMQGFDVDEQGRLRKNLA